MVKAIYEQVFQDERSIEVAKGRKDFILEDDIRLIFRTIEKDEGKRAFHSAKIKEGKNHQSS